MGTGPVPSPYPWNSPASLQAPPASSLWPLHLFLTPLGLSPLWRTSPGVNVCQGASASHPPFAERKGGPEKGQSEEKEKRN